MSERFQKKKEQKAMIFSVQEINSAWKKKKQGQVGVTETETFPTQSPPLVKEKRRAKRQGLI